MTPQVSSLDTDVLALHPLAYYKFDELSGTTLLDTSGNSHNLTNATPTSITLGAPGVAADGGTSYNFTSTSSVVDGAGASINASSPMTIVAFVNGTYSSAGYHTVACFPYFRCLAVDSGHLAFLFPIYPSGAVDTAVSLTDNTPHMLVLEMAQYGGYYCYGSVDGSPLKEFNTGCGYNQNSPYWEIGKDVDSGKGFPAFVGEYDDIAVFNGTMLTQAQICKLADDAGFYTSCPTPTPSPTPSATPFVPIYTSNTWTNDQGIYVFNGAASGNIAPVAIINPTSSLGALLGNPVSYNGNVYVEQPQSSSILAFPTTANGNVAATYTISGSNVPFTPAGHPVVVRLDSSGNVYAALGQGSNGSIAEFPAASNGNVVPLQSFQAPNPFIDFAVTKSGNLWVADTAPLGELVEYPSSFNGSPTSIALISGSSTDIGDVFSMGLDGSDNVFVLTGDHGTSGEINYRVLVFPAGSNGNVTPTRVIEGNLCGFQAPDYIAVDASGGIYVADAYAGISYFAPSANGNVAPIRNISGTNAFGAANAGPVYVGL